MADVAHNLTDKKLEEMERRISAIYSRAEKEIQKRADEFFDQFKRLDAEKAKQVKAGQLSEADYKTWRRNKILYSQRFTDMKEQAAKQLLNVNKTAVAYINDQLPEVYSVNYNALEEVVDGVGGYSFTLTDPQTIKHLALTDTSLLPFKEIDPAKDIPWNMEKINSEVLQGIIQGDSIPKIAARIGAVEEMNKNAAVRSARTIVTEAENKGRLDSYVQAEKDGIELRRVWISTDDARTRPWHAELDGVDVAIDEPWENSVGKIMFPGDPTANGANVYNCRCTQIAKVMGFNKAKVKAASAPKAQPKPRKVNYQPFKSGESASEYFTKRANYQKWESGLTSNQFEAIKDYTGETYAPINEFLRGTISDSEFEHYDHAGDYSMKWYVKGIDSGISKFSLNKDITVYRTCESDFINQLKVGDVFHDSGYVSTSVIKEPVASGHVKMEIDVPRGKGVGAWVNEISRKYDEEYEFLLARGTNFEVESITQKGEDTFVKMKVVGREKDDISFKKK